jgi:hypothetical protein
MDSDLNTPQPWRVRPAIWLLMCGSIILTLLAPTVVLWRDSALPLAARACLWPAVPRFGAPAYVVVTFSNDRDRTAVNGPWAQLVIHWDMATMPMRTRQVVLHGPSSQSSPAQATHTDAFVVPLQPTMVGAWWARISLQTPGRPTWSSELRFMVSLKEGGASAGRAPPPDACVGLSAT